jgi:hypothetical protein
METVYRHHVMPYVGNSGLGDVAWLCGLEPIIWPLNFTMTIKP